MKPKRKRLLLIGVAAVIVLIVGGVFVRWYVFDRDFASPGDAPPAPSAPVAPNWSEQAEEPEDPEEPNGGTTLQASPDEEADPSVPPEGDPTNDPRAYGWPDDFELPLHIEVDEPEVPEGMAEPAAPIEEDESAGQSEDRLTSGPAPERA